MPTRCGAILDGHPIPMLGSSNAPILRRKLMVVLTSPLRFFPGMFTVAYMYSMVTLRR